MKNRGLGRGLSALLKDEVLSVDSSSNGLVKIVNINMIEAGVYQPRKNFESDKIQELANSIASNGLLQPIIVTLDGDKYKIVAGERRWRACRIAGVFNIPVIVKDYSNQEILKVSLLENIQREDISAIEEAEGFNLLIKEFNYTQEELSNFLGKSRSHVANLLRLNQLPESIKDKIRNDQLSMGHARCLIGHENVEEISEYIINNKLSVRQTENLVKNWHSKKQIQQSKNNKKNTSRKQASTNSDLIILVENLSTKFGVKVTIEENQNRGKLIFHFEDYNQLDSILTKL